MELTLDLDKNSDEFDSDGQSNNQFEDDITPDELDIEKTKESLWSLLTG